MHMSIYIYIYIYIDIYTLRILLVILLVILLRLPSTAVGAEKGEGARVWRYSYGTHWQAQLPTQWPRGETTDFQENPAGSRVPALVATMGLGSLSIGSFASYENTSSLVYLPTFCEVSGAAWFQTPLGPRERGAADPSTLRVSRRAAWRQGMFTDISELMLFSVRFATQISYQNY